MKWLSDFFESISLAREACSLAHQNKFDEAKKLMLGENSV